MKDGKKVNLFCIADRNHEKSVVVLDHFRDFEDIQLIVEYNIKNEEDNYPEKRKLLFEIVRKLKNKKLLKITRQAILDEKEP